MITGTNALQNQYVPTFYINNITDGQILIYDAARKAFINATGSGAGAAGATRLGQLLDVSAAVDIPLSTIEGQALVYNSFTGLWTNQFIDYNTLLNQPVVPTNGSFSFAQLSDTAKPSLPDGYVKWNSTGTQLVYSTTIPAASITGLATVAYTGNYNDLLNKPTALGTVTSVSVLPANGVSGTVANPTSTPAITLTLGTITPTSIVSSGTISGSNLSGVNTGDQVITLTGDVTGSGTAAFSATLATVNSVPQANTFRKVTVNGKGLVTATDVVLPADITSALGYTPYNATNPAGYTSNTGTVTSVQASGGTTGLTFSGGPITASGTLTLAGTLGIANGGTGQTTATGAINALVPSQTGNAGMVLTTNGSVVSWVSNGSGTVTSVSATGANGIVVSGSPITTSGTIALSLGNITPTSVAATGTVTGSNLSGTNTGDQTITLTGDVIGAGTASFPTTLATVNTTPGTYADAHFVPTITVNAKGLVTSITTQQVDNSISDLVAETDTITIDARHQYIVTGTMEVQGTIVNNGRLAIL